MINSCFSISYSLDQVAQVPLITRDVLKSHESRQNPKLAKKKKFSSNWKKQKAVVTRLHRQIAAGRNDYLRKATTDISKNHAMVVVEDAKVNETTLADEYLLTDSARLLVVKRYPKAGKEKVFIQALHPTHSKRKDLLQKRNSELKKILEEQGFEF